jgi:cytochrome c oxidase subunit II
MPPVGSPLFPDQASTMAPQVDALFFFLVAVSAFFSFLIAALIVYFSVRYRRRSKYEIGAVMHGNRLLEVFWILVPFAISMIIFVWGALLYFRMFRPPEDVLNIYVVGKQWMWKFQHVSGQSEINELHVPVGRDVRLTMTSQDVIHDVFLPAFRVKADVIPGRFTQIWFQATKPGRYHLFCAEYCGLQHSRMTGQVVAMEQKDYQAWLSGGEEGASLASEGERKFQDLNCGNCHLSNGRGRGPALEGVFGKTESLEGGGTVQVDEDYLRESIMMATAKLVAGYPPIMPSYQAAVSDEELIQLIEYIKSLRAAQ